MHWMLMPLRRYADFSGRSRRMEFWMWQLFQLIIYFAVTILAVAVGGSAILYGDAAAAAAGGGMIVLILAIYGIWGLVALIPSIAVAVRRLHDTERTGWWVLSPIVPYLIFFVAVILGTATGTDGGVMAGGLIGLVAILAAVALAITLLVFYLLEGTRGPNRYGPDPKAEATGEVFA